MTIFGSVIESTPTRSANKLAGPGTLTCRFSKPHNSFGLKRPQKATPRAAAKRHHLGDRARSKDTAESTANNLKLSNSTRGKGTREWMGWSIRHDAIESQAGRREPLSSLRPV